MSEEQKRILEKQLWAIANLLRGKMDADDYRNYILGFIFFKYLSEKLHNYANEILKTDPINFEQIDENSEEGKVYLNAVKKACIKNLGYFLKPSELFTSIANKGNNLSNIETNDNDEAVQFFIIEDLERILNNIEQSTMGTDSEDDFVKLFEDLDLTSSKLGKSPKAKNEIIAKILSHLDQIDFQLDDSESDLLGDAYEYLIGEFAAGAGKKAGEFYTPQQVSTILAKIVTSRKSRLKSVYDPTCGSGSLLLRVAREVGKDNVGNFYGQELNRTTYNLARMNMILHDVHFSKFDIKQEDTLEEPQHIDIDLKAEAIVANPPFSANWSAKPVFSSDDRFSQYGKLAPKSKADFAFVQHMVHHLDDSGIMATVLPHGVLFRGGAEAHIRKYLIEDRNYIDAVIGLPANIFFGTGIPTCILVIKKCREINDDVLFIDASKEFEKKGKDNKLLPEHIDKIVTHYRERKVTDKFSHRATLKEIKENDYNLNIPRYVDTFEEEESIDIDAVSDSLKELSSISAEIDSRLKKHCKILNIPFPDGNNVFLLEQYKKGVMQKIFNQELRFKDDNGKEFPKWVVKKLGEVATKKSSNISANTIEVNSGVFKIYGASGFLKKIDFYREEEPYISIVKDGAGVGRTLLCDAFSSVLGTLDIIKPKKGVNLYFIYCLLNNINFLKFITGSTIPHIYFKDYSTVKIKIPCLEEQTKIANFLSDIDMKIEALNIKIENSKTFKKGLLQQMFV